MGKQFDLYKLIKSIAKNDILAYSNFILTILAIKINQLYALFFIEFMK